MTTQSADIVIIGAGPVGLMCAYLAELSGLNTVIIDQSEGPLQVGRADALNARTLQLLELAGLFDELYPLGKTCNTSSVWENGKFISRQSSWWDELEGCFHRHFLMIGQSYLEKILDDKLKKTRSAVRRATGVRNIEVAEDGCVTTLSNGDQVESHYVIGADGSHSFVRSHFNIPFEIIRPEITWAVIDGVIETDFPKVPEIIVFQTETSDVAWIPREGNIDRFYIRMDQENFTLEETIGKINRAIKPHHLSFKKIEWFSRFSVKESVAEKFFTEGRVFLAGDACHIHSVNGGQGLNTGLADAFNLMWKLSQVLKWGASKELLKTYESERKPVAQSVIESSGELVRATKYSASGTHAQDYVEIVRRRAGNITGMGIRYGNEGPFGTRLYDLEIFSGDKSLRLYSILDYTRYTLIFFGDGVFELDLPENVKVIRIHLEKVSQGYWTPKSPYINRAVLTRPDSYIEAYS
jgi:2-polyprenyl-6-methoxyphenol hydroxylase-like FAD-dependent oxidoreductase